MTMLNPQLQWHLDQHNNSILEKDCHNLLEKECDQSQHAQNDCVDGDGLARSPPAQDTAAAVLVVSRVSPDNDDEKDNEDETDDHDDDRNPCRTSEKETAKPPRVGGWDLSDHLLTSVQHVRKQPWLWFVGGSFVREIMLRSFGKWDENVFLKRGSLYCRIAAVVVTVLLVVVVMLFGEVLFTTMMNRFSQKYVAEDTVSLSHEKHKNINAKRKISSEQQKQEWQAARMEDFDDCRIQLSFLLGSIGAPPLRCRTYSSHLMRDFPSPTIFFLHDEDAHAEDTEDGHAHHNGDMKQTDRSASSFASSSFLSLQCQDFVQVNIQLMKVMDDAMQLLRVGTSLRYGCGGPRGGGGVSSLAAVGPSMERVERAQVGRFLRQQQQKDSPLQVQPRLTHDHSLPKGAALPRRCPLALPVLRRTIFVAMKRQREVLLTLMTTFCKRTEPHKDPSSTPHLLHVPASPLNCGDDWNHCDDGRGEGAGDDGDENNVVMTVSLLRGVRKSLGELLTDLVDMILVSQQEQSISTLDHSWRCIQATTSELKCLLSHLESCFLSTWPIPLPSSPHESWRPSQSQIDSRNTIGTSTHDDRPWLSSKHHHGLTELHDQLAALQIAFSSLVESYMEESEMNGSDQPSQEKNLLPADHRVGPPRPPKESTVWMSKLCELAVGVHEECQNVMNKCNGFDDDCSAAQEEIGKSNLAAAVKPTALLQNEEYILDRTNNDDGERFKVTKTLGVRAQTDEDEKILVFSGTGSAASDRSKQRAVRTPAQQLPAAAFGSQKEQWEMEQAMIRELQSHLRALPRVEEMDANHGSATLPSSEGSSLGSSRPGDTHPRDSNLDDFSGVLPTHNFFASLHVVGELQKALMERSTDEGDDAQQLCHTLE